MHYEEVDRLLQELAAAQGRPVGPSIETSMRYASRLGEVRTDDLRTAIAVWQGRDRWPTPAELRDEANQARFARLDQEANERRNLGPARQPASPEFARARLAEVRRVLAAAKAPPPIAADESATAEVAGG